MIQLESELSAPISLWLESQGFVPYAEVLLPDYGRHIDLIGRKGSELIVVELKRTLTSYVIHQAYRAGLITSRRYAATAAQPRSAGIDRCRKLGIGILKVTQNDVSILLEPKDGPLQTDWTRTNYSGVILKRLEHMKPYGMAGLPTRKGEGPAQDCYDNVITYRKTNPRARWQAIYDNVPNHYCSAKSLACAMRVVQNGRIQTDVSNPERRCQPELFEQL